MNKRLVFILFSLIIIFSITVYVARQDIKNILEKVSENFQMPTQQVIESNTTTIGQVQVHFLDIGQGDASLIIFPNGEKMLVDCSIDARILESLGRVLSFRDHTIDYLVATHPDQDHFGGCVDVLKRYDVKHIYFNEFKKEGSRYLPVFFETVKAEPHSDYIEVNKEQSITIASTTIHFLYPDAPLARLEPIQNIQEQKISNNTSVVFLLQFGTQKVLFTGDAEVETENYLLKKYGNKLDSDVLKVGHHGSKSSSSQAFLNVVTPKIATISAGKNNDYGHPSLRTLKKLERVQAKIWRTDQKGDILITITPQSVYVNQH